MRSYNAVQPLFRLMKKGLLIVMGGEPDDSVAESEKDYIVKAIKHLRCAG